MRYSTTTMHSGQRSTVSNVSDRRTYGFQQCDPKTDPKCIPPPFDCKNNPERGDANAKTDPDLNLKTKDCDLGDANEHCIKAPCPPSPICPDGSTLKNGICQCPTDEHFDNNNKCVPNKPEKITKTVIIRETATSNIIVHDFTEFTINPTNSRTVVILPTQNIQDATTKNINMFGTILNTGSATAKSVGEVRATILDKDNKTLAALTAVATAQTLKSQSSTTFHLVISTNQVKLTDVKFIEFELVPLRTGSASVVSSSSS
jgi:hypothetical protein